MPHLSRQSVQQAMKLQINAETLKSFLVYDSDTGVFRRISNRQGGFKLGALIFWLSIALCIWLAS